MEPITALKAVDLQWTAHIDRIWDPLSFDVPEINAKIRRALVDRLDRLTQSSNLRSPLGVVVVGQAGAGKTHLLGTLREEACRRNAAFVLLDMTDVRNFAETARLGFFHSLFKNVPGRTPQYEWLLDYLLRQFSSSQIAGLTVSDLAKLRPPTLTTRTEALLGAIARVHRREALEYQDVIRALVLLNSDDWTLQNVASAWLQGLPIDEEDELRFGFSSKDPADPYRTLRGLCWAFSLPGPMVLALDQIDAIVTQQHTAAGSSEVEPQFAEERVALSIIEGIGQGLLALRDITRRTLIVMTCLETTWNVLSRRTIKAITDRYEPPLFLEDPGTPAFVERMVGQRLQDAFSRTGFQPPYSTWPFKREAFGDLAQRSPRRALRACALHVRGCIERDEVTEIGHFDGDEAVSVSTTVGVTDFIALDQRYADLLNTAKVGEYLEAEREEQQDRLVETLCECLADEQRRDGIDVDVDPSFVSGKAFAPLHARIRCLADADTDKELHLCIRFIQHQHHRAFQARLKAAITAAGIDRALNFRRLLVLRTGPLPTGKTSSELADELKGNGGLLRAPSLTEVRTLIALAQLRSEKDPKISEWLRTRKPVSQLPCLEGLVGWMFGEATVQGPDAVQGAPPVAESPAIGSSMSKAPSQSEAANPSPEPSDGKRSAKADPEPKASLGPQPVSPALPRSTPTSGPEPFPLRNAVPLGNRLEAGRSGEPVEVPIRELARHTVVLAGSGSGKTVFLRRLVEEAALLGVPSVVIDPANDLARLGDRWPTEPASFDEHDRAKADEYFDTVDVRVWTPGRDSGNPLTLDPMPDLSALVHDSDELEVAIEMARTSLEGYLRGRAPRERSAILQRTLKHVAEHGGGGLPRLIEVLADPPPELIRGFSRGDTLAEQLSDALRAEVEVNRLLRPGGEPLDPAALFGVDSDRVRVSVVNLSGLPDLVQQQIFIDQLASTLFAWIKKNPKRDGLRGLLVIDEAKDFVPSGKAVPCRDNLLRLAAQARKYGLGLVFATQEPKSIDHKIIANCNTQVFGKVNSPAAIEVVREQITQRGGNPKGLPDLKAGQFYVHSEGFAAPLRIASRLCLSHHPSAPLDESEVLERARRSR